MRTSTFVTLSVALLCIVSASYATAAPSLKAQIALRALLGNNVDMTSGILDGMSYVAGVPQLCNKAHNDVSNNFVEGARAFALSFQNPGDVADFERGLRLFGMGIASSADTMEFCGLNTIVSNWTKVANQIAANPGRGVTNLMNSLATRIQALNLPNLVQQINNDLARGDEYSAGVKIGSIIATILTPNVPNTNFLVFLETLGQLVFLVKH